MQERLSQKALKGTFYFSALKWLDRLFSIISGIILARLLEPKDFGLVALAMTAITMLQSLTQIGLGGAIIHRQEIDRKYYDVAWSYGYVGRGFLLFLIFFLTAPWIAIFYKEPQLTPVIRVLALNEILWGVRILV